MVYTCTICGETFARCAFVLHKSNSKCYPDPRETNNQQTNQILSKSSTEVHSTLRTNKSEDSSLFENGSLFMVVKLDNNNKEFIADQKTKYRINSPDTENKVRNADNDLQQVNGPSTSVESNCIEDCPIQGQNVELEYVFDEDLFEMLPNIGQDDVNEVMEIAQVEELGLSENGDVIESPNTDVNLVDNIENLGSIPNTIEAPKGYTKNGNPRKRAAPKNKNEIKSKREKNKDKHPMQPPCGDKCKRKCNDKISEERRIVIHEEFWSLEEMERKVFILGHVDRKKVSRKTTYEDHTRRENSFFYHLNDVNGERQIVCKTFFLSTLGFNKKNDMLVFNVLKKSSSGISPQTDKRGKHRPHNYIDRTMIKNHILKYNPCISHYRREHAPNRKYLPAELSIMKMHNDFLKEYEGDDSVHCSYDLYREVISGMNISFTKLGHEECEKCTKYKIHNPQHIETNDESCSECNEWILHNKKYKEARKAYENYLDKENLQAYNQNGLVVCSMDLQKVIMLPQMEQFKEAVFTRRIVLFNESFVPVGNKQSIEPVACIWHEGVSGRKKEDITSALDVFISHYRDAKEIHLWMDNCASQNKNWSLFSYMVGLINSSRCEANKIIFNYLEPGHTFMSADHFHHQVNQQVKAKGKVYDFEDFEDAVKKSNSGKVVVKSLQHTDFFLAFDFASQYKIMNKKPRPYLNEMVQVIFERGSFDLNFKLTFDGELQILSFLKTGYLKKKEVPNPERRKCPRGVNQAKKLDIIQKLVPLMPPNRRSFWMNLVTSEEPDLITELDVE